MFVSLKSEICLPKVCTYFMNTTNGNMGVDLKRSISILGEDKRVSKQINS